MVDRLRLHRQFAGRCIYGNNQHRHRRLRRPQCRGDSRQKADRFWLRDEEFSVVGKGYHTDEKVVGFYNAGDRVKFWGKRGAFWGGLWGMFFGGLFLAVPVVGHVVVLGYLAAIAISAIETAVMVGGLSALGAALYSIGIPKDSVIQYETALEADSFLVMAHGTAAEMARAKALLDTAILRVWISTRRRRFMRRLSRRDHSGWPAEQKIRDAEVARRLPLNEGRRGAIACVRHQERAQ